MKPLVMLMSMTIETNGQQRTQPRPRSSKRDALLWGLSAVICFVLAGFGFGAGGPWYIFLGSIVLSAATGNFVVKAVRALRSMFSATR